MLNAMNGTNKSTVFLRNLWCSLERGCNPQTFSERVKYEFVNLNLLCNI